MQIWPHEVPPKSFQFKRFFSFVSGAYGGRAGGVRGASGEGGMELRRNPGRETSSAFFDNRGFYLRRPQLFEIIESRGLPLLSDRAKSFIRYRSLELKL